MHGRAAHGSKSFNLVAFETEVFRPKLANWVKYSHLLTGYQVNRRNPAAFMQIASGAGQREIFQIGAPALTLWDYVLDVKVAPCRLSCIRQYWHRALARARTARDSSSDTVITAACLESAMPRRGRATIARSIQPALPVLHVQIPAKGLRCCGPSVPEGDGRPSMENGGFQQPLPSLPARQLWSSYHHLKTPWGGRQWRAHFNAPRLP